MTDDVTAAEKLAELEALRAQAQLLGIPFHTNTGAKRLSELIAEHQAPKDETDGDNEPEAPTPTITQAPAKAAAPLTAGERAQEVRKQALKLVRVIVTPNDPNKRDYDGDFFSGGNSLIGTHTRYVPYNNENGWHVEQIILDIIRSKKVTRFVKVKTAGGVEVREARYSPAYAVQVLPDLTKEELAALGASQRARQAID